MTDKALRRFKQKVESLALAPFADGRFEVFADDRKVYSKLDTGEFPDEEAVLAELEKAL